MSITKIPTFPALLKNQDGTIIGEGEGVILHTERAVNFLSDFVPLYPIGTPLQIDRLYQNRTVHRFMGKVFLSDRTLLRLVSVQDELLPGSENVYCGNMDFPAIVRTIPLPAPAPRFRLPFFRKPVQEKPHIYHANITSLTVDKLELVITPPEPSPDSDETSHALFTDFAEHARLVLNVPNKTIVADEPDDADSLTLPDVPPIPQTQIIIEKRLAFGSKTSCLCRFVGLPQRDLEALQQFLWLYNLQRNQLF